jgi:hypothetical protein
MANIDPGLTLDRIVKIVHDVVGEREAASMAKSLTIEGSDANDEPIDIRKDLLGQLAGPVTFLLHAAKPYTDADAEQPVFTIAVRDAAALDKTLARLHGRVTEGMSPDEKKELVQDFQNTHIYILPGQNPLSQMMGTQFDPTRARQNPFAFAVAGQQLVVGGLSLVQQCIRDARKEADKDSLVSDALYDYAMKFLPAQAGVIGYANQQVRAEIMWTQLKEAAVAAAKAQAGGAAPPRPARPMMMGGIERVAVGGAVNPMSVLVEMLKDFCDFTTLPDFAAVRQYFGAETTSVLTTDDGILLESHQIRAPAK